MSGGVVEDLEKRGVEVTAFIVAHPDGRLQLIQYDKEGVVTFLSDKVPNMSINQRLEGNMIRPVCDIVGKVS